jgi:hypothetical protein
VWEMLGDHIFHATLSMSQLVVLLALCQLRSLAASSEHEDDASQPLNLDNSYVAREHVVSDATIAPSLCQQVTLECMGA